MAQLTTLTTPPETRTFTVRKGTNTHNGTLQVPCVVIPGTLVYITTAASQISYNGRPSTEVNDILPPGTVLACQRRGNQTTYAIFRTLDQAIRSLHHTLPFYEGLGVDIGEQQRLEEFLAAAHSALVRNGGTSLARGSQLNRLRALLNGSREEYKARAQAHLNLLRSLEHNGTVRPTDVHDRVGAAARRIAVRQDVVGEIVDEVQRRARRLTAFRRMCDYFVDRAILQTREVSASLYWEAWQRKLLVDEVRVLSQQMQDIVELARGNYLPAPYRHLFLTAIDSLRSARVQLLELRHVQAFALVQEAYGHLKRLELIRNINRALDRIQGTDDDGRELLVIQLMALEEQLRSTGQAPQPSILGVCLRQIKQPEQLRKGLKRAAEALTYPPTGQASNPFAMDHGPSRPTPV